ncbi:MULTISPECIES: beta-ketoacyl synthase chain length factor [Halomonas]|uniref:beta-ketoacyl synthase chain length factor n=1 Tax=Halomonas TaxID=2745 RepID=UPI0020D01F8F|nr:MULTISPECIES: beta-ketoacyl synthase chain length factor [Halomonas]
MSFPLYIEEWLGWLPEETIIANRPNRLISAPLGGMLPAILRRRLDDTGRATCDILRELDPQADAPLVHASRHGDTTHTLAMLESLQRGEPISPTRFSMSVHNAILGVHSIAQSHHRPLQALGACGDEFDALVYESHGYLMAGYSSVVAVFSESSLPAAYQGVTQHPGTACVVGMRFTLNQGRAITLSKPGQSTSPTPVNVLNWLNGETTFLDGRQRWHLEQE